MGNSFFVPGTERAARVRSLFDQIAPKYDLINDIQSFGLHRLWKRKVARLANARPGDRVLDVCCGTGDLAARFAETGAYAVALDFSVQMLERAAKRHASSRQIHFVRADTQQLPFRDETFDVVTIGYGLRNLAEWGRGVKEMIRVLKPGGRLVVLEFGRPNFALWRSVYFAYLRLFVPVLGLVFCGNAAAYGYILESLKSYPGQKTVAKKMEDLGLSAGNNNILGGAMAITWGRKSDEQNLQKHDEIRQNS